MRWRIYSSKSMKLLFLTNFYPPLARGGYEQWCQEIAEGLRHRGHEVVILTSRHDSKYSIDQDPAWIHRTLRLEMEFMSLSNGIRFFTNRKINEKINLEQLRQVIDEFVPDYILIWGMWNLPRSLPASAETLLPDRVIYYIGDYWPVKPDQFEIFWQVPASHWFTNIPKRLLRPIAEQILKKEKLPDLKFNHVIYPSYFMKDELARKGLIPKETHVIYGAVDLDLFKYQNIERLRKANSEISLLYVGRLTSEKGVHTAIDAVDKLVNVYGIKKLKFLIVGSGDKDYEMELRNMVQQKMIDHYINFLGPLRKEELPPIYRESDIFLFTSIWPEPFGRVLVEAMVSGVNIVGTSMGGASEILIDNENSLVFCPGDSDHLASQISRLIQNPTLAHRLAECGRRQAIEKYDINNMVSEIEAYIVSMN
jgi:glycosyltransferase involved in cell wall biosynthesis